MKEEGTELGSDFDTSEKQARRLNEIFYFVLQPYILFLRLKRGKEGV